MRKKHVMFGHSTRTPSLTCRATSAVSPSEQHPVWTCYDRDHILGQTGSDSILIELNHRGFSTFGFNAEST